MPVPPGVRTAELRSRAAALMSNMQVGLFSLAKDSFGKMLYLAAREATAGTSQQVIALAETFRRGIAPSERVRAFQFIGERAQKAIVGSYDAQRGRGGPAGYRQTARQAKNRRFAGGRLRRALNSPSFFEAHPDGLRFINMTLLDREAIQWARFTFGARPAGRGSHARFQVRWSNLVVASLGIDESARPAFRLPKGYWWSGEVVPASAGRRGTDEFYPVGEGPSRRRKRVSPAMLSRGIPARSIFDAGYRRIAEDLPDTYEQLYKRLFDDAVTRAKLNARGIVTPRPTPLASSVTRAY